MPLLDEGQLSAAAAQLWWSNFAFAVLRLWLLIMAGDVELNPGPVAAGRSGGWLGVSDGVAAQLLALLWGGWQAGWGRCPLAREQQLERPAHGWDYPAMKVLASSIDAMLPAVLANQGLLSADVHSAARPRAAGRLPADSSGCHSLRRTHSTAGVPLMLCHVTGEAGTRRMRSICRAVQGGSGCRSGAFVGG